jgi:hypothetical protein
MCGSKDMSSVMWGRTYTRRRRARDIRRAAERAAEQARDADAQARGAVITANRPHGGWLVIDIYQLRFD